MPPHTCTVLPRPRTVPPYPAQCFLTLQALTTHECAWSEVMATRRPRCRALSSAAPPPAPALEGEPLGDPLGAQEWADAGDWDRGWDSACRRERARSRAASRHTSTASLAVPCKDQGIQRPERERVMEIKHKQLRGTGAPGAGVY